MGAIELAKVMRSVMWQSASHSDMLANRLGAKMAGKPRRSMSRAMSSVARLRPGTATRLMAGSAGCMAFPFRWLRPLTQPLQLLQRTDGLGFRRLGETGLPVGVGDLANVDVALGVEGEPVRRQELAGFQPRSVLAAEAGHQLALGIDDRQARPEVGCL